MIKLPIYSFTTNRKVGIERVNRRILLLFFGVLVMIMTSFNVDKTHASSADFDWYEDRDGMVIVQYLGTAKDVVIPETIEGKPVIKIFSRAFSNKGLTSVTIPQTVTDIGSGAFEKNALKELHIPSNVKVIGTFAFSDNQIAKLTFDEGLQHIGSAAFSDNQLTAVTFPASLQKLKGNAFGGNKILSFTFKGPIELEEDSVGLMVELDGELVGWYTDQAFKNKWNGKITGPTTINSKWKLKEIAKKVAIDNLSGNRVKLTKLEKDYTYTLYEDAALTKKLVSFEANDIERFLNVKQIGQSAGNVYVTVTTAGYEGAPVKIAYKAARTPSLAKSNVTVKYAKNKSTIQLKNLKVGTTYTIYRNVNQTVKIASFKATKTTATITTNKLIKSSAQLYITTQQPNLRISTLAVACYPKTHLCPNDALPSGVSITETNKEFITFKTNYTLTDGGTVTQVKIYKISNKLSVHFDGIDTKKKRYSTWSKGNGSFGVMGYIPVLGFGTNDLLIIEAKFKALLQ